LVSASGERKNQARPTSTLLGDLAKPSTSGLEVQALRNEAEALWGKSISEKLGELLQQSVSLHVAMRAIVSDKEAFGANFRRNEGLGKQMEAWAFDSGTTINDDGTKGGPNEFTAQIEKAVEDVAAYLRTKLPRLSRRRRPTPTQ
jgi:hypothetical protein